MLFDELKITKQYLQAMEDLGFEAATPIQVKAIPAIRSGQHVIGIAQTGTGKTAAYVLPILMRLSYPTIQHARCLILVPTKELVIQVVEQIQQLATYTDFRIVGLYGGVGRKAQTQQINQGVDIIVSTPRRMLELYEFEHIKLNKIEIFVVDEADRMMDMGFLPQINTILEVIPTKKQNLLFSATFSPKVEELSWDFMDFPIKIEITPEATPVETVEQRLYVLPNTLTKLRLLLHFLQNPDCSRVIVFTKTKARANEVNDFIQRKIEGNVQLIHSNKGQNTRINAFKSFKEGTIRVLVSTDVMARGIDIKNVSHVINFDVPSAYEDYVHRIGRTGRAFRTGSAFTFMTEADQFHINQIEKKIRMAIPRFDIPDEVELAETPFEEHQQMMRQIDELKKKEDPTYKGAFHEKKDYKKKVQAKKNKKRPTYSGKGKSQFIKSQPKKKKTSKRHRNKRK